jgi:hypothetical protein
VRLLSTLGVLLFGLGAIGSLLTIWVDASFIPTIPKLIGCLAMLGVVHPARCLCRVARRAGEDNLGATRRGIVHAYARSLLDCTPKRQVGWNPTVAPFEFENVRGVGQSCQTAALRDEARRGPQTFLTHLFGIWGASSADRRAPAPRFDMRGSLRSQYGPSVLRPVVCCAGSTASDPQSTPVTASDPQSTPVGFKDESQGSRSRLSSDTTRAAHKLWALRRGQRHAVAGDGGTRLGWLHVQHQLQPKRLAKAGESIPASAHQTLHADNLLLGASALVGFPRSRSPQHHGAASIGVHLPGCAAPDLVLSEKPRQTGSGFDCLLLKHRRSGADLPPTGAADEADEKEE